MKIDFKDRFLKFFFNILPKMSVHKSVLIAYLKYDKKNTKVCVYKTQN